MKNLSFLLALLSVGVLTSLPAKAASDAGIPVPIAPPLAPVAPQMDLWDNSIQVVELLKVIAKTFKVGIIIDEDVTGILSFVDVSGKSAEEALQYVARNAGLNVQREHEGTYLISKKTIATAQNLANNGFALQIKLDKSEYKSGENISTTATLSLAKSHYNAPEKALIEGFLPMGTLQPTIIALKDHSQIPLSEAIVRNPYINPPIMLTPSEPITKQFELTHNSAQAMAKRDVRNIGPLISEPYVVLQEPLAAGRYLYFVTYFSQASPIYNVSSIWSGHLASNVVEFEVK